LVVSTPCRQNRQNDFKLSNRAGHNLHTRISRAADRRSLLGTLLSKS
jgi:hypothetical protein